MDTVIWILQALLAFVFAVSGSRKVLLPRERYVAMQAWAEEFAQPTVRAIGGAELLGAVGLILPGASGVATGITALAASGLILTMIGAATVHWRRLECRNIAVNAALLAMAAVVLAAHM